MSTTNKAPTFAVPTGGWLQVNLDNNDTGKNLVLQPDGKIVVSGDARSFYAAIRLNTDGTLDQTFGSGGKAIATGLTIPFGQAYGVALTSDGSVVIGGNSNQSGAGNLMAVRLTPDGQMDTNFGNRGQADMTSPLNEYGLGGVAVQASGKVLIGGYTQVGYNDQPFTLGRLNADGSVDTSFGTNGLLRVSGVNGSTGFFSEDADGNILVVGKSAYGSSSSAVVRLTADGQMDTSFGTAGRTVIELGPSSEDARKVILQADGKILVIGDTGGQDLAIARLNANGTPDTTFGTNGSKTIDMGTTSESAYSAAVQDDGKIVMVGSSVSNISGALTFNLVATRLNTDGTLDTSFANAGKFIMNQGGIAIARDVAIQPDGKIVIAGYGRTEGSNNDFIVIRLHADGTLDNSFNTSVAPGINTLDGVASYTEGQPGVVLDSEVSIYDAELAAQGHYGGAKITLSRQNDAEDEDVFGASGNLSFDTGSGNLSMSGVVIGTFSQTNGILSIQFNDQATQIRVDETLSSITYQNTSSKPPASVTIVWLFDDGNDDDSQGQGGRKSAVGFTEVNITDVQSPPTLGGIEPIGGQTEDVLVTMDLALLKVMGDAADTDGTVTAFRVTEVVAGSLRLGADEATAQDWQAGVNDTIDANTKAFWQPPADKHGNVTGFRVVAIDNEGLESTTPVAVRVELESVPDRPVLANGATLAGIDEDVPSTTIESYANPDYLNLGDSIDDLLAASGYSDGDNDQSLGIAIAGDASDPLTEGRWQYYNYTDGAGDEHWVDIGAVSPGAALLLHSDGFLRFVPVADFNGTPGGLTVHAVDISGSRTFTSWDGDTEDRHTVNVASAEATDISAAGVTWTVEVASVPDAPVITGLGADDDRTVPLPSDWAALDIGQAVTITDVDTATITSGSLRVAFTGTSHTGDQLAIDATNGRVSLDGTSLIVDSVQIGTASSLGGSDAFVFALTNATMAQVALVLQHVNFTLDSQHAGERIIKVTLNDGDLDATTEVRLDGKPMPTVSIALTASTFTIGQDLDVTFVLSEASTDFTADDVLVTGGTLGEFAVDVHNPLIYRATITPTSGANSVPVSVSVAADSFSNASGWKNLAATPATANGDTLAPSLVSIAPVGTSVTSEDTLTFRVVFSEDVFSVDDADFTVTGASGASVSQVMMISGDTYDVTVSGGNLASFNGEVGLALATDSDIIDAAGNTLASLSAGSSTGFTLDNTPPVLTEVEQDEVTQPAVDQSLQIKLSFTETGSGIDADSLDVGDITVSGPGGIELVVTDVDFDAVTGVATYTVSAPVGGWDMDLHAGQYTVAVNADAILDKAGLAVAADSAAHTFTVRPLPKVEVSLSATSFKAGEALTATFTLTDETTDFTAEDVTVEGGTLTDFAVDPSNPRVYTATLTPTAGQHSVPVSVSVEADRFENADGYGNAASAAATATGDTLAPTLTAIALANGPDAVYTSEDSLSFLVSFDETVLNVGIDDFRVTGSSGAVVTGVNAISPSVYEVTIGGAGLVDFNGDVGIALAQDATITDAAGNPIGSLDAGSSQDYVVDNTAPVLVSIEREDVIQPAGSDTLTIQLTLAESGSGIDADTVSASDITVTGPGGTTLTVSAVDYDASTGVATYTLAAPTGGWDLSVHAGLYTVALIANEVFDRAGLALTGNANAHTFEVIANLNPVITSNAGGETASINHAEGKLAVTTVTATDPDGDPLAYAIVGGVDAARFTIDPASGALVFNDTLWSSTHLDDDANGVYEVVVEVTDGKGGKATQALSVSVLSDIDGDGIPDIEDTDADGDGVLDVDEAEVPDLIGDGRGDGNGDGVGDGMQLNVASIKTVGTGTPDQLWATVAVADGLKLTDVTNEAAPGGLPRNVKMPAGQFGFTIEGVDVGGSTQVSFYLDASRGVNAYYKQNQVTGAWTNIGSATPIPGSDKVRITFDLVDGGVFDADGMANGVIVDPGGAAILGPRIISHGGDVFATLQVYENIRSVGIVKAEMPPGQITLSYAITGGADAARFTIDAATGALRFIDLPDYEKPTDAGADNVYDVEVTVSDQNDQSDTQAIAVTILDVDESVPGPGPAPVDGDGDGLPDDVETGVPGMIGGVRGDGNGDGIPDIEQADVTSLIWSQAGGGQPRYVTLTNDARLAQKAVSTSLVEASSIPTGLTLPLGALAFTVTDVPDTGVVGFSIYVDGDVPVNGYWKLIDGQWLNLATAITEVGGKTRIDFSIEDGGRFDADGVRNGVIVDPGAPGWFDGNPYDTDGDAVPDLLEAQLGLVVGVKDNDVFDRDDLFVMQLYRDALGRESDVGGLAYWQGQLAAGEMARSEIVEAFVGSAEAQDVAVLTRLSLGLRDAPADTAELAAWRAGLQDGDSVAELATAFVTQAYGEMAAGEVLDRLYEDLFGRAADDQGKAYWTGQLQGGASAGEVAVHLAYSAEFEALHGQAAYAADLYAGLLGRGADAAGLAYWADALQHGMAPAELIGAIAASREYHDRFLPSSDADLVG